MNKQTSIIVSNDNHALNQMLDQGYRVVHTCAMPSSVALAENGYDKTVYKPTCLVILEEP